jgi:hypothetical protein
MRSMPHNGAMRRSLAILAFAASIAASSPAWADTAEATKAFEEGRRLRDQRDFEKAAAAFERSVAAERSIGGYYNLAFSYEQLGRTRDALDAYRASAAIAKEKNDPREKEANEAVTKLLETHNYVTLQTADDVATTAGLRIVVDGEVVPAKQYKGEVFRSGSQHEILVTAPGRREVRLQAGNKQAVPIVLGESAREMTAPPPVPPSTEPTGVGWGWQQWTGVGVGVAGLATIGVGVVLTLAHASEQSDLESSFPAACRETPDDPARCTPELRSQVVQTNQKIEDNKTSAATTLGIVYGLGGVLLVTGIITFLTAPSGPSHEPSTARLRVVPQLETPHGAGATGLTVLGSF